MLTACKAFTKLSFQKPRRPQYNYILPDFIAPLEVDQRLMEHLSASRETFRDVGEEPRALYFIGTSWIYHMRLLQNTIEVDSATPEEFAYYREITDAIDWKNIELLPHQSNCLEALRVVTLPDGTVIAPILPNFTWNNNQMDGAANHRLPPLHVFYRQIGSFHTPAATGPGLDNVDPAGIAGIGAALQIATQNFGIMPGVSARTDTFPAGGALAEFKRKYGNTMRQYPIGAAANWAGLLDPGNFAPNTWPDYWDAGNRNVFRTLIKGAITHVGKINQAVSSINKMPLTTPSSITVHGGHIAAIYCDSNTPIAARNVFNPIDYTVPQYDVNVFEHGTVTEAEFIQFQISPLFTMRHNSATTAGAGEDFDQAGTRAALSNAGANSIIASGQYWERERTHTINGNDVKIQNLMIEIPTVYLRK